MKKTFRAVWLALIAAIMVFALAACGGPTMEEVVGEYEATSVEISITMGDTTITAGKEYYQYFKMEFKEDGTATVSAKYQDGSTYSSSGTFTCGGGKIRVTTSENGISVTETYSYSDGVITFKMNASQQGMTIKGTIELTKVNAE